MRYLNGILGAAIGTIAGYVCQRGVANNTIYARPIYKSSNTPAQAIHRARMALLYTLGNAVYAPILSYFMQPKKRHMSLVQSFISYNLHRLDYPNYMRYIQYSSGDTPQQPLISASVSVSSWIASFVWDISDMPAGNADDYVIGWALQLSNYNVLKSDAVRRDSNLLQIQFPIGADPDDYIMYSIAYRFSGGMLIASPTTYYPPSYTITP